MKYNINPPFFSIILPVYNVEKYLDRCIESILSQGFENYEIILVDDGSKDKCPQMCDVWAEKDCRIKVIHKHNAGLGLARNSGLEVATGKYVFFIDSDDYILPGLLQDAFCEIEKNNSDAVFYGFSRVDVNQKVLSRLIPNPEEDVYTEPKRISNYLLPEFIAKNPHNGRSSNIRVSAWNCCLNLELLKKNNLCFVSEREYISEDLYFYIELFSKLKKVSFLKKAYYCYCQNVGSLTFSYRSDRFQRLKEFYQAAEKLADQYEYDGEVQLRLKASFIANVLGCLKMETGNVKKAGVRKAYHKIKIIVSDEYLIHALNEYPQTYYSKTWKVVSKCILRSHTVLLFCFLIIQYRMKGV